MRCAMQPHFVHYVSDFKITYNKISVSSYFSPDWMQFCNVRNNRNKNLYIKFRSDKCMVHRVVFRIFPKITVNDSLHTWNLWQILSTMQINKDNQGLCITHLVNQHAMLACSYKICYYLILSRLFISTHW